MSSAMMSRVGDKIAGGRLPARPARLALRATASLRPSKAVTGGAVVLGAVIQAAPALADVAPALTTPAAPTVDVDSTIDQLIAAVKAAVPYIKSGVEFVGSGVESVKEGYSNAEPYLQQGYTTVAPYVQQAIDATGNAVQPVLEAAVPILKESVDSVDKAVSSSGVHLSDVVGGVSYAAQTGAATALPLLVNFARFVTTTSPTLLGEYALGGLALVLVGPTLLGALVNKVRSSTGEVTAAAALDLLFNGRATLIDLRTAKEKEASGVPDLPANVRDRVVDVEYAVTEDRRLRSLLRDPAATETEMTALKVASLRRVDKGSKVLLLDRNGSNAAGVAKELAARGFTNVSVVTGGFDGRRGWVQSKLQVKPATDLASLVPSGTRVGTRIGTRKQLMAPR